VGKPESADAIEARLSRAYKSGGAGAAVVQANPLVLLMEWEAAIAQQAREGAQREIDAVDAALPVWKYTGRGRVETIKSMFSREEVLEFATKLIAQCDDDAAWNMVGVAQELAAFEEERRE
tara:strand:- start:1138 stop:1500 length:363 start_codon:yes stop_codon:yes gene_type:complete